jgi:hypothetical protein
VFVRLNLALIGLGALLGWVGYDEFKVSEEASPQAQQVELAALEAGQIPDNTHLEIGPHWRMYQELVFRYELDRGQTEEDLTDGTKVDYSYFPILSHTHPLMRQLANLEQLYGSLDEVPEEQLPAVEGFAVLVKTHTYKRVSDLPPIRWAEGEPVRGLVVNRIQELESDEVELIRQSFPKVAIANLLILEHGRKPASAKKAFGMMGGGAGLGLSGIGLFAVALRGGRRDPVKTSPEPMPPA